jgi:hypothetical protein
MKFVVVSATRSGSNLFCGTLNTHPQLVCFHEMFHKNAIYCGPENHERYDFGPVARRDADPMGFVARIYSIEHGFSCVGFKMFEGQNDAVLHGLVKNGDVKKIVLKRHGLLHAYVSREIARESKVYQSVGPEDRMDAIATKVNVDPKSFEKFVRKRMAFFEKVHVHIGAQPYLGIDYADVSGGCNGTYRRVLEFLGLDPSVALRTLHQRQNPARLNEKIGNLPELRAEFRGTEYESYLEEEW